MVMMLETFASRILASLARVAASAKLSVPPSEVPVMQVDIFGRRASSFNRSDGIENVCTESATTVNRSLCWPCRSLYSLCSTSQLPGELADHYQDMPLASNGVCSMIRRQKKKGFHIPLYIGS